MDNKTIENIKKDLDKVMKIRSKILLFDKYSGNKIMKFFYLFMFIGFPFLYLFFDSVIENVGEFSLVLLLSTLVMALVNLILGFLSYAFTAGFLNKVEKKKFKKINPKFLNKNSMYDIEELEEIMNINNELCPDVKDHNDAYLVENISEEEENKEYYFAKIIMSHFDKENINIEILKKYYEIGEKELQKEGLSLLTEHIVTTAIKKISRDIFFKYKNELIDFVISGCAVEVQIELTNTIEEKIKEYNFEKIRVKKIKLALLNLKELKDEDINKDNKENFKEKTNNTLIKNI
jgi:hypothetical protein